MNGIIFCMSYENMVAFIRQKMAELQMGQIDLAKRSGLSASQVSRILNLESTPSQDAMAAIARALKVPPESIFRAAGLLQPKSEDETRFEDWKYMLDQLSERDRNILRDLAEKMVKENEKERGLKSLNPRKANHG